MKFLEDIGDLAKEQGKVVPYAKNLAATIRIAKDKRLDWFLRSLRVSTDKFDSKKRAKFREIVDSDNGAAMLADYADRVVRTSSEIAISAFGVLYSDTEDSMFTAFFKKLACLALEGISDFQIEMFLALTSNDIEQYALPQNDAPYPFYCLRTIIDHIQCNLIQKDNFTGWIAIVNNLIHRGMLYPDFARNSTGKYSTTFIYGVGEDTKQFRDLLVTAKAMVGRK